jgi:methyl-accepting chemotaxis protein
LQTLTRAENQQALKRLQDTTLAYDQQVKRLVEADKATSDALKPLGAMSDKYAETFNRLFESATASALASADSARWRTCARWRICAMA